MGRPPLGPKERKLRGDTGKRGKKAALGNAVSQISDQPAPQFSPPAWLSHHIALAEWRRLLPLLMETRILKAQDVNLLAEYCNAIAMYSDAQKSIAEHGVIYKTSSKHGEMTRANPALKVIDQANKTMARLGAQLGIGPKARYLLQINAQSAGEQPDLFGRPAAPAPAAKQESPDAPSPEASAAQAAFDKESSFFSVRKH